MRAGTLGTLTIGQAPRADVVPIIDRHVPERVEQHAGGRFYIEAGTPSPYLRAASCTRHADYDQLTFDKGWILNVKVFHEF